MATAALVARLLLAAVFAVAAVAKLRDRAGSRAAVAGFGVPAGLVGVVALALPLVELAAAVLLLVPDTARVGAVVALVLLLAFVVAIGRAMARGEAPDCHCFGALHSEPAGPRSLVRNVVLGAVAVVPLVASDVGPSPWGWIGDLDSTQSWLLAAVVVLGAALVAQGGLLLALLRQNGRILRRLDALEAYDEDDDEGDEWAWDDAGFGLPVGTPAPAFALPDLDGVPHALDALLAPGRPLVLVFASADCGSCVELLPRVAAWRREHTDRLTFAVVSQGGREANRAKVGELALGPVLMQEGTEVADAYRCGATPIAVAVGADGRVALPAAPGPDAVAALVATLVGEDDDDVPLVVIPPAPAPPPASELAVGTPAPALSLVDLDGEPIELADPRARARLLVFWNPSCGFCAEMVGDLRALGEGLGADADAPELVLVSSGTAEENRAQRLPARIALDPGFTVGAAFGAAGTPSAVLLDSHGRVAAPLGVGAPAVLALLGASRTP